MQTASEFMESYLAEQAAMVEAGRHYSEAIHWKFFTDELAKLYADMRAQSRNNPEILSSVEVSGEKATCITSRKSFKLEIKHRYHLRQSNGQWQVQVIENGCGLCGATGRRSNETCPLCHGAGWMDFLREARNETS